MSFLNSPEFLSLNQEQRSAVILPMENCLVIAGAGSGKTKTLISRILYLVEQGIQPERIVALTFTNKAANEMKQRLGISLKEAENVNLGTFHSFALKLIKEDPQGFGYKQVRLLDESNQIRFAKRLFIENQWSDKNGAVKNLVDFVNDQKELGRRACQVPYKGKGIKRLISQYEVYEETAREKCYLDFGELMLALKERLAEPQYRQNLRSRYDYFLVDEFQDTNPIQYELLNLLTDKVFAVGDDCQSIYAFRGAVVKNLFDFQEKSDHVVKLEQNYRSTQNIVNISNEFISTAKERIEKNLISNKEEGALITLFEAYNEKDEAKFVSGQINYLIQKGVKMENIAVLYRGNSQSDAIETELYQQGLPYKVSGGMSFFEREEIKTVLAAANLLLDRNHEESLIRLADKLVSPKLKVLLEHWQIEAEIEKVEFIEIVKRKTRELDDLLLAIEEGEGYFNFNNLRNAFYLYLKHIGIYDEYSGEKLERIESFLHQIDLYEKEGGKSFEEFIDNINNTQNVIGDYKTNVINLMTIHSSKGLEFDYTFIVGVEEGVIPSNHAIEELNTEEEKRLFYVAMTRAKKELYLSYCLNRFNGFEFVQYPRSSFIDQLNPKYISTINCAIGEQVQSEETILQTKSMQELFEERQKKAKKQGLKKKNSDDYLEQEQSILDLEDPIQVEPSIENINSIQKNEENVRSDLKKIQPYEIIIGESYLFNGERGKVLSLKENEYNDYIAEIKTLSGMKKLALSLTDVSGLKP